MRCYRLIFCLLATLLAGRDVAIGQRYLGIATDGWSAINTLYLNPANVAGREEKIAINLFSFDLGAYSNIGKLSSAGNLFGEIGKRSAYNLFNNSGSKSFSNIAPDAEIRGPGILISVDNRNTFAISTGFRAINQITNFSPLFYNSITTPGNAANASGSNTFANFNWTSHMFSQVGFSWSTVVLGPATHQINVGITAHYLAGVGYTSLRGSSLNVEYTKGSDSFLAKNTSIEYASNFATGGDVLGNGIDASKMLSSLIEFSNNSGISADFGVSYFYRPKENFKEDITSGNGYKLRVSASVTDLGYITYKGDKNGELAVTGKGYITGNGLLNNSRNFADFSKYLSDQNFRLGHFGYDMTIYLPTSFILMADYQIKNRWYLNFTYAKNLMNKPEYANSYADQISFIPRYDSRVFSLGIPISYSALNNGVKAGFGIRYTAFFAGTDNLFSFVSSSTNGFGFYVGANIPVFKEKENDEIDEYDP